MSGTLFDLQSASASRAGVDQVRMNLQLRGGMIMRYALTPDLAMQLLGAFLVILRPELSAVEGCGPSQPLAQGCESPHPSNEIAEGNAS